MKRLFLVLAILVLCVSLIFSCAKPTPAPTTTPTTPATTPATAPMPDLHLRYASVGPPPPALIAFPHDLFQKKLTELYDGKITFENYWSGSLIAVNEILNGIQGGVMDMCQGLPMFFPTQLPLISFDTTFPFGLSNAVTAAKIKSDMFEMIPALVEEHTKNNIKVQFMYSAGSYDIQSTVPIKTFDDLKGVKIAVAGSVMPKWMEPTGAVPVMIPGAERYVSLQRGTVDASLMPIFSAGDDKWGYEVCKHYTIANLGGGVSMFQWIRLDLWNSLSPAQQKVFEQAAKETQELANKEVDSRKDQYVDMFKKEGVTFYTMSDADRAKWAALIPDLPAEWAKQMEAQGLPGWEIVDTYMKLTKEAGHKWPREWGKR